MDSVHSSQQDKNKSQKIQGTDLDDNLDANLRSQILLAVLSEQKLKGKRSSSLVLTGVPFVNADDDMKKFTELCKNEFAFKPSIRAVSRLGKPGAGKTQPLLVILESKTNTDHIVDNAKMLRNSASPFIRQNVYINKYRTRTAFLAAYKARQSRKASKEKSVEAQSEQTDTEMAIDQGTNSNKPNTIPAGMKPETSTRSSTIPAEQSSGVTNKASTSNDKGDKNKPSDKAIFVKAQTQQDNLKTPSSSQTSDTA